MYIYLFYADGAIAFLLGVFALVKGIQFKNDPASVQYYSLLFWISAVMGMIAQLEIKLIP